MSETLLFTLIACFGMLVQSVVGFGGPLVAVPLFALLLSPREAIPTYNLVMIPIDLWLVFEARGHVHWGKASKLLLGGLIGIPIGAYGLKYLPADVISLGIGVMTSVFAVLFLLKIRIRVKQTTGTNVCVGLLSGFLGGSISQAGPPVVIYGLARDWDKNTFRATLLAYFTCLRIVTIASYLGLSLFSMKNLSTCSVAIIPAFAVSAYGVLLKDKVSEDFFRKMILVVVVGVGVANVLRSIWPQ